MATLPSWLDWGGFTPSDALVALIDRAIVADADCQREVRDACWRGVSAQRSGRVRTLAAAALALEAAAHVRWMDEYRVGNPDPYGLPFGDAHSAWMNLWPHLRSRVLDGSVGHERTWGGPGGTRSPGGQRMTWVNVRTMESVTGGEAFWARIGSSPPDSYARRAYSMS